MFPFKINMKLSRTGRHWWGVGCALAFLNLASANAATTNQWTNSVSGLWSATANWSSAVLPSTNFDYTLITNAGTKTVTLDSATPGENRAVRGIVVSAPSGFTNTLLMTDLTNAPSFTTTKSFTVDPGGALLVTNSTLALGATLDITGDLTLNSGLLDTTTPFFVGVRVGRVNGATGTVTLNGGILKCFGFRLGELGGSSGLCTINGGVLLSSSVVSMGEILNSSGTMTILAGQLIATNDLTKVGNLGPGIMNINGGSASLAYLSIADNAAGTLNLNNGLLTVTPQSASDWTRVGNLGRGQFNINGGTALLKGEFHIGDNLGTTGIVAMVGGQLFSTNDLTAIGRYGFGQMTVSNATAIATNVSVGRHTSAIGVLDLRANGSFFAIDDVSIGRFTNAVGYVFINGGLLSLTNDTIWVGREGIGNLTVSNGTARAKAMFVGMSPDLTNTPQGTVILTGGSIQLSSNLVVGTSLLSTGHVVVAGGNLTITNTGQTASFTVASGSFTLNQGTVAADNVLVTTNTGQFTFNGGTLQAKTITVANGAAFIVGDGVNPATFQLQGGTYSFANGLVISPNATVTGCGTIIGSITNNGTLSTNCGPTLKITRTTKSNSTVTVFFTTIASSNHVLEYKTNLSSPGWSAILPGVIGNGSVMSQGDANATNTARFYRVHLQ